MAINKSISSKGQTHASLKNVIAYVLQDEKVKDGYVAVTGPYDSSEITATAVYDAFIAEKRLWGKDTGRMYIHSTLSFHKDEAVTPEKALEIGERLATEDSFYRRFQTLVAVHQDKDHVHVHFLSNSVSFLDGYKHQHGKADIEALMQRTDELCREYGLTIAEKGKHFDGTQMKEGDITSSRTKDYRLLTNDTKNSWKATIMVAVMDAAKETSDKDTFIAAMKSRGINVAWSDSRKHILFTDQEGHKIRGATLGKSFNVEWLEDKDALQEVITNEFAGQTRGPDFTESGSSVDDGEVGLDLHEIGEIGRDVISTAKAVGSAAVSQGRRGVKQSADENKKNQKRGAHL